MLLTVTTKGLDWPKPELMGALFEHGALKVVCVTVWLPLLRKPSVLRMVLQERQDLQREAYSVAWGSRYDSRTVDRASVQTDVDSPVRSEHDTGGKHDSHESREAHCR